MSWAAYLLIGTASPAAMTLIPAFARSAGVLIADEVPVGTMIVSLLRANATGAAAVRPLSTSFWGLFVSADRKTSAGAPCSICVSSVADESVEIVSFVPAFAVSYVARTLSRTPFRDAAP